MLRAPALATVAAAALAARADAQDEPRSPGLGPVPRVTIPRIETAERPEIDGVVAEDVWSRAAVLDGFRQVVPVQAGEPSEDTQILVLYHERGIVFALRCWDRDPAGIRGTQRIRDAVLDPDDRVEILMDPFLDRRNAFWFQIGPAGGKGDALISGNGSDFNKQWDGIWYGRSRVTPLGWEAEIEIPVNTINFDPAATVWGFNARRFIKRRNEEVRWATPLQRVSFFSVANAGRLSGIHGLHQGVGLDLVPFAVADYDSDRAAGDLDRTGDVGLDAFYNVTPNVKLSLSFNTDFAETEVDDRQVNLTRFPLFFPEKRDFFLEDAGSFTFGTGRRDALPFFSRRIGLDGAGNEVPLLAAAKLTGRTEGYTFGLLDVQTDDSDGLDSTNLFVGRFSKNVLEQSDVGVILTHGDPTRDRRNTLGGVDFNYRTNDFFGRNLNVGAALMETDSEGTSGSDRAALLDVDYPNDQVDLGVSFARVEENFDPALGFVPRRDVHRYAGDFAWRPRLHSQVRSLRFSFAPVWVTTLGNHTQTLALAFVPIGVLFESGDEVRLEVTRSLEVLDQPFGISPGVTVPAGSHWFTRAAVRAESADKRPASVAAGVEVGEFFDGYRTDVELDLFWRPGSYARFSLELERSDVDLPGGDFFVHVARLRADVLASQDLSWSNFLQFDNVSDTIGLNSRLWYILRPGQEMFLVLNQGWDAADSSSIVGLTTGVTFKVGYTLRF